VVFIFFANICLLKLAGSGPYCLLSNLHNLNRQGKYKTFYPLSPILVYYSLDKPISIF